MTVLGSVCDEQQLAEQMARALADAYNAEHAHGPGTHAGPDQFAAEARACARLAAGRIQPLLDSLVRVAAIENRRVFHDDGDCSMVVDAEGRMRTVALDALAGSPAPGCEFDRRRAQVQHDHRDTPLFDGGRTSDAWRQRCIELEQITFDQRQRSC